MKEQQTLEQLVARVRRSYLLWIIAGMMGGSLLGGIVGLLLQPFAPNR